MDYIAWKKNINNLPALGIVRSDCLLSHSQAR